MVSGSVFPPGNIAITCSATDACGNSNRCTFAVTVIADTNSPAITCPTNLIAVAQFTEGAAVWWDTPVTDNVDPNVTVICNPPSGTEFVLGTTPVLCEATDASGNLSRCSFTVTVVEPPPLRLEQAGAGFTLRWIGERVLLETFSLTPPVYWRAARVPVRTNGLERIAMIVPARDAMRFFQVSTYAPPPSEPDPFDDDRDMPLELPGGGALNAGAGVGVPSLVLPQADARPQGVAPTPLYSIRIHAIRTANDDGSQAGTITANQVKALVDAANTIYASVGIQFLFDPLVDFATKNSTLFNHDFSVSVDLNSLTDPDMTDKELGALQLPEANTAARNQEARKHKGQIVVYFRRGDNWVFDQNQGHWTLGQNTWASSSWAGEYVLMFPGSTSANVLPHELGHYLQNRHTFAGGINTVADAAAKIKAGVENGSFPVNQGEFALENPPYDSDWILDTPTDVGPKIFDDAGIPRCGPVDHVSIPVTFTGGTTLNYQLKPQRENLMNYFGCTPRVLTPQQIARARDGIENGMRQVLVAPKANAVTVNISRRGDAVDIAASEIAVVRTGFRQVVTAFRDGGGFLCVVAWSITANGEIERQGEAVAGQVSKVTACSMGLGLVATAVRDSAGNLKVIVWQVLSDGQVVRKGDASAGAVSEISLCRWGIEHLATAVRDGSGGLTLIGWHVTASGEVSRQGTKTAGAISQVSVSPIGPHRVVTAVRNSLGNLQVIVWEASSDRNTIARLKSGYAGAISAIDAFSVDVDLATTTVRNGSGNIQVIAWRVTDDGSILRKEDAVGVAVSKVASTRLSLELLATAVRSDIGNLRVFAWEISPNGNQVLLRDESVPGAAGGISEVATCRVDTGSIVTAVRNAGGQLQLIVWRVMQ